MAKKTDETAPAVKEKEPRPIIQRIIPNEVMKVESALDTFLNPALFEQLQRGAALLAASKLVPDHFKNDVPSCFIALELAARMKMDPIMLMQRTYVVHGKPGFEAQFVIALINSSGRFRDPLSWEMTGTGPNRKAVCFTYRHDGRRVECEVTMEIAKAEGWIDKKDSKWKTIPDLMLQYRSASWFGRLHCPEVMMGMATVDELEDVGPSRLSEAHPTMRVIDPEAEVASKKTDAVASRLKAKIDKNAHVAAEDGAGEVIDASPTPDKAEEEKTPQNENTGVDFEHTPLPDLRSYAMDLWLKAGYDEDSATRTLGCTQNQWTRGKCIALIQTATKAIKDQEAAGL